MNQKSPVQMADIKGGCGTLFKSLRGKEGGDDSEIFQTTTVSPGSITHVREN